MEATFARPRSTAWPAPLNRLDETQLAQIDRIFRLCASGDGPGAAVGISSDGRPLLRRGYGLASMESRVTLSPNTRMRIGALGNQMVAMAFLLLCEAGRADLDEPIASYLSHLHPSAGRVTMRQLLGQSSGLRDVHELCWQFRGMTGETVSSEALLALYTTLDTVNAPPSGAWIYNHGGYLLASAVIEAVSGDRLEDHLRRHVFAPAGMHDTFLRRTDRDFVAGSATLHPLGRAGFWKSDLGNAMAGEGGIVSTVDDLLRWMRNFVRPTIGRPESWAALVAPGRLTNGSSTGYGLGLVHEELFGHATLQHIAGMRGASAQMIHLPDPALDIVVLVNRGDAWGAGLADRVAAVCLGRDLDILDQPAPLAVNPEVPMAMFRSPATGRTLSLALAGAHAHVAIDGLDVPYERRTDGGYEARGVTKYLKRVIYPVSDSASPEALQLEEFGLIDTLVHLSDDPLEEPFTIAGDYVCAGAQTRFRIWSAEGGPRARSESPFGVADFRLVPLGNAIWRSEMIGEESFAAILDFGQSPGSFSFSAERTRALPFVRSNAAVHSALARRSAFIRKSISHVS